MNVKTGILAFDETFEGISFTEGLRDNKALTNYMFKLDPMDGGPTGISAIGKGFSKRLQAKFMELTHDNFNEYFAFRFYHHTNSRVHGRSWHGEILTNSDFFPVALFIDSRSHNKAKSETLLKAMQGLLLEKSADLLYSRYFDEIMGWDWKDQVGEYTEYDRDADAYITRTYIGSVLSLYPSGKYYMPWTSNQTDWDVHQDEAYSEALNEAAAQYGWSVTEGEGSATDLFIEKKVLEVGDSIKILTPLVLEQFAAGDFDDRETRHWSEGTATKVDRFDQADGEIVFELDGNTFWLTFDQVEKVQEVLNA